MRPLASGFTIAPVLGRKAGLAAGGGRSILRSYRTGREKTGSSTTDRCKAGKHRRFTDAQGIPISATLTEANRHDVTQLLGSVEAIPPIAGKIGHPLQRPKLVQEDRWHDSEHHRKSLAARGIKTLIVRRRTVYGSWLGKTRWVVERTIAWLRQFRKLRVLYERLANIHEASLKIGCAIICWRFLQKCAPSLR